MHDIIVIVRLTLTTIEIEIVISLSHIIDEHLYLVEKLSPTIIEIVVKRKQANR